MLAQATITHMNFNEVTIWSGLPDTRDNPTLNMISKISEDIHQRSMRGETRFPQDIAVLESHANLAREFHYPVFAGKLLNLAGVICGEYGLHARALAFFEQAGETFWSHNSLQDQALVHLNIATSTLFRIGEYEEALANLDEARQFLNYARKPELLPLILSSSAFAHMVSGQIAEAENRVNEALEMVSHNYTTYRHIVGYAYQTLAEVALGKQNYESAWQYANFGMENALQNNHLGQVALNYLTKAHIADADPEYERSGDIFMTELEMIVMTKSRYRQTVAARAWITEAFYNYYRGNQDTMHTFANKALPLITQAELREEEQALVRLMPPRNH